jgi:hypothetical protein
VFGTEFLEGFFIILFRYKRIPIGYNIIIYYGDHVSTYKTHKLSMKSEEKNIFTGDLFGMPRYFF